VHPGVVADDASGEGLFSAMGAIGVRGRRFLFPRAERGRDELPSALRAAGATVDVLTVYRTVEVQAPSGALDPLRDGEIHVVTFASPSAVERFAAMAPDAVSLLGGTVVAVIGPTTRQACEHLGVRVDIQPEQHTIPALAQAIADHCQRRF
jgi:uroporphyrinogen III methyltransferase/synthase